ncbi:Predicted dehydrogenase [Paracoccus aminovorans]|uniref:Predicted dehydrogenase n=1 Tax=Paracoccus aminovorans TaxID=34004 RepID=A0A1I3BS76_9RHOB|nr:Gfo/Idh/MocA family oxidoreductase [Paracoccus aminovorans]CQR86214.1 oxidoreductase [Paracoccus aminovorans]SFH65147.1 Predicted dehydrogenase [Paracoccus aminovorans]
MTRPVRLAVMGAGLIGKRHAMHVKASADAELACVIDPTPAGEAVARDYGTVWAKSLDAAIGMGLEGVIVATPNQVHMRNGLDCIAAGIPALVEKPLCDNVADAETLVAAADAAGVALLTGHHRRHNLLMQKAKEIIDSGAIGTPVVANAMFWLFKPDDYFDIGWRREKGAGPVFLNLIHDVDNLRYLLGEVAAVTARESNAVRGNAVEETAVILLEFASGALATASVCDTTVAPWSWEMTTGENLAYPRADEHCYLVGGTHGSLALPELDLRTAQGQRSWYAPFDLTRPGIPNEDPLARQVSQFARVIRGKEAPLVSGRDGLETLRVIEAVKRSAAGGGRITL